MKELIAKINSIIDLSPKAEQHVITIAKERSLSKGEILIRQGQTVRHSYFVKDGCLRSFCIDKNGKEHTLQFAISEWWMSDFVAVYNNEQASLTVECITDSNIIEFSNKDLNEIFSLFPEFEAFQRRNLERRVASLNRRILNQLQLNAMERYELFLNQYSDIEKYISNYHVASCLGITQQSLSRIRAEM